MSVDTTAKSAAGAVTGRGDLIAKLGTVISALLASSCCWLPLLLLAIGVSGAGIAATLATYRPILMAVTFSFLGAAFYFTYRPRRATSQSDCCAPAQVDVDCCGRPIAKPVEVDCCGQPIAKSVDCCATSATHTRPRINMMMVNKAMLWVVTAMAIFFLFFPGYFAKLMGAGEEAITADMQRSVIQVEGMTCEGCAPIASKAIHQAPGVLAVQVKYSRGMATIGTDRGQPVPKEEILASLKSVGFKGRFVEP